MRRVIVLAETKWIGHYETQMKLLAGIILKWGWNVIVLCPEPRVMEYRIKIICPNTKRDFTLHFLPLTAKIVS